MARQRQMRTALATRKCTVNRRCAQLIHFTASRCTQLRADARRSTQLVPMRLSWQRARGTCVAPAWSDLDGILLLGRRRDPVNIRSSKMALEQRRSMREKLSSDPREREPVARDLSRSSAWRDRPWGSDPFSVMGRIADHMDRWFLNRPLSGRSWETGPDVSWVPQVESFQRGNQFVVRADLPGIKKDDVAIEINDDTLT